MQSLDREKKGKLGNEGRQCHRVGCLVDVSAHRSVVRLPPTLLVNNRPFIVVVSVVGVPAPWLFICCIYIIFSGHLLHHLMKQLSLGHILVAYPME